MTRTKKSESQWTKLPAIHNQGKMTFLVNPNYDRFRERRLQRQHEGAVIEKGQLPPANTKGLVASDNYTVYRPEEKQYRYRVQGDATQPGAGRVWSLPGSGDKDPAAGRQASSAPDRSAHARPDGPLPQINTLVGGLLSPAGGASKPPGPVQRQAGLPTNRAQRPDKQDKFATAGAEARVDQVTRSHDVDHKTPTRDKKGNTKPWLQPSKTTKVDLDESKPDAENKPSSAEKDSSKLAEKNHYSPFHAKPSNEQVMTPEESYGSSVKNPPGPGVTGKSKDTPGQGANEKAKYTPGHVVTGMANNTRKGDSEGTDVRITSPAKHKDHSIDEPKTSEKRSASRQHEGNSHKKSKVALEKEKVLARTRILPRRERTRARIGKRRSTDIQLESSKEKKEFEIYTIDDAIVVYCEDFPRSKTSIEKAGYRARPAKSATARNPYTDPKRSVPPWHRTEYVLNKRETKMYKHISRVYGNEGLKKHREDHFYRKVIALQLDEWRRDHENFHTKQRHQAQTKNKQKKQLKNLRSKFDEEQLSRFRSQYVTSRVLEHEWVIRGDYGLPDELDKTPQFHAKLRKRDRPPKQTFSFQEKNSTNHSRYEPIFRGHGVSTWNIDNKPPKLDGVDTVQLGENDGHGAGKKVRVQDVVKDAKRLLDSGEGSDSGSSSYEDSDDDDSDGGSYSSRGEDGGSEMEDKEETDVAPRQKPSGARSSMVAYVKRPGMAPKRKPITNSLQSSPYAKSSRSNPQNPYAKRQAIITTSTGKPSRPQKPSQRDVPSSMPSKSVRQPRPPTDRATNQSTRRSYVPSWKNNSSHADSPAAKDNLRNSQTTQEHNSGQRITGDPKRGVINPLKPKNDKIPSRRSDQEPRVGESINTVQKQSNKDFRKSYLPSWKTEPTPNLVSSKDSGADKKHSGHQQLPNIETGDSKFGVEQDHSQVNGRKGKPNNSQTESFSDVPASGVHGTRGDAIGGRAVSNSTDKASQSTEESFPGRKTHSSRRLEDHGGPNVDGHSMPDTYPSDDKVHTSKLESDKVPGSQTNGTSDETRVVPTIPGTDGASEASASSVNDQSGNSIVVEDKHSTGLDKNDASRNEAEVQTGKHKRVQGKDGDNKDGDNASATSNKQAKDVEDRNSVGAGGAKHTPQQKESSDISTDVGRRIPSKALKGHDSKPEGYKNSSDNADAMGQENTGEGSSDKRDDPALAADGREHIRASSNGLPPETGSGHQKGTNGEYGKEDHAKGSSRGSNDRASLNAQPTGSKDTRDVASDSGKSSADTDRYSKSHLRDTGRGSGNPSSDTGRGSGSPSEDTNMGSGQVTTNTGNDGGNGGSTATMDSDKKASEEIQNVSDASGLTGDEGIVGPSSKSPRATISNLSRDSTGALANSKAAKLKASLGISDTRGQLNGVDQERSPPAVSGEKQPQKNPKEGSIIKGQRHGKVVAGTTAADGEDIQSGAVNKGSLTEKKKVQRKSTTDPYSKQTEQISDDLKGHSKFKEKRVRVQDPEKATRKKHSETESMGKTSKKVRDSPELPKAYTKHEEKANKKAKKKKERKEKEKEKEKEKAKVNSYLDDSQRPDVPDTQLRITDDEDSDTDEDIFEKARRKYGIVIDSDSS